MLDRLVGVETEYVLRFQPRVRHRWRISNADLFARIKALLETKVPLATALVGESSWFLANGGGLRFERLPFFNLLPDNGFVEGATPECRGPGQYLRYQRAQDALLSQQAAASGGCDGAATLLKISHDGHGHCFGCHENYETTIATGRGLRLWRVALALTLPVLFLLFLFADLTALLLVGILTGLECIWCRLTGRPPGRYYAACTCWLVTICRMPLQIVGATLVRLTAFRHLRPRLLPFLITRTIISGPGMVCPNGRFVLSPRAAGIRSVCGMSAAGWRSIFYFCPILKGINEFLLGDWPSFNQLFRQRQRLQLTIGDSNMSQVAEYLKIGTTLLVLDAIEAGALEEVPRLRRPLKALRTISGDPDLQATLPLVGGGRASALEIQRFYLNACRRYLRRSASVPPEAEEVVNLWEETLDALEVDPERLVGKIDWVTKRYLLAGAGQEMSIDEQRKLDMRYHELSRDGYYLQLEAAGVAPTLAEPEDVIEAMTVPPEGTPATLRGRLIRQHASVPYAVRASWTSIHVPVGSETRVIRLS